MKFKNCLWLVFLLLSNTSLWAQYNVRFIVTETDHFRRDSIFISGNFNNWDSTAASAFKLASLEGNSKTITLKLPAGDYSYKYTGGNWRTVEKRWSGDERANHSITVHSDMVIRDTVKAWRDLFMPNRKWDLTNNPDDTTRLLLLAIIANAYAQFSDTYNTDSSLSYIQQSLQQLQLIKSSEKLKSWSGYENWLIYIQEMNASLLHALGNYTKSLELRFENLQLARKRKQPVEIMDLTHAIVDDYIAMKDFPNALNYCQQVIRSSPLPADAGHLDYHYETLYYNTASCFSNLNLFDSAKFYAQKVYTSGLKDSNPYTLGITSQLLGDIYLKTGAKDSSTFYYKIALAVASKINAQPLSLRTFEGLAKIFQQQNKVDTALFFALSAFGIIRQNKIDLQVWGEDTNTYLADLYPLIADLYMKKNQPDSAYKYLRLSVDLKDSLYDVSKIREFQNLSFNESIRQQQADQLAREAKQKYDAKITAIGSVIFITALALLALVLYYNNRNKQKANKLLATQKKNIEETLSELKTTQKQLVQSEKMASLGELTAGIAHEIQNPLNFINNFAEVNVELIGELKTEWQAGNAASVSGIIADIAANEEKINQHGRRADAIVKSMLQHSRSRAGQKELTDINQLADEYLRLAYHGLRAKDKSFNASFKTDFDNRLRKIEIIPEDIGRVLLNLYGNAFYAVTEKKKQLGNDFDPTVLVTTRLLPADNTNSQTQSLLISVKDNGTGIPPAIADKIFQPFFTTKPTGQGTGLGLSLSYDIIQAHRGTIRIISPVSTDTPSPSGTEIIVELPYNPAK